MLLSQLPDDVLYHILSYLDYKSLGRLSQVCKSTYHFINRDAVWRRIAKDFLNTGITRNGTDRWESRCSMMRKPPSVFSLALAWAVLCASSFMTAAAPPLCFRLFDTLVGMFYLPKLCPQASEEAALDSLACQSNLSGASLAQCRTHTQVNDLWWLKTFIGGSCWIKSREISQHNLSEIKFGINSVVPVKVWSILCGGGNLSLWCKRECV